MRKSISEETGKIPRRYRAYVEMTWIKLDLYNCKVLVLLHPRGYFARLHTVKTQSFSILSPLSLTTPPLDQPHLQLLSSSATVYKPEVHRQTLLECFLSFCVRGLPSDRCWTCPGFPGTLPCLPLSLVICLPWCWPSLPLNTLQPSRPDLVMPLADNVTESLYACSIKTIIDPQIVALESLLKLWDTLFQHLELLTKMYMQKHEILKH